MLISLKHGFLFVHVPKNAGTSITTALQPYALPARRAFLVRLVSRIGLLRDVRYCQIPRHASLRHAQRLIEPRLFKTMCTFAVVRNPWDRLVSQYHYILQFRGGRQHRVIASLGSFSAFIEYWHRSIGYAHRRREHLQSALLAGEDGSPDIDVLLRYETLQADWESLMRTLGLQADLSWHNPTVHRDYREYYSPEDAALVAKFWKEDIDTFGYSFESD